MSETERKCGNCESFQLMHRKGEKYSHYDFDSYESTRGEYEKDIGECRFDTPSTDGWPVVSAEKWCRAFEPKKEGERDG